MAKPCRANDTENDPGEIPLSAAHSDQVVAASGQKRSCPEESCEMDTDDTGGERAARRACLALVEQMVLQLHGTQEEKSNATREKLIIREEDWANHEIDGENLSLWQNRRSCESSRC